MQQKPLRLLFGALFLAGCATTPSAPPSGSPSQQPAVVCHEIDTSTPPEITRYEQGGVTVHTFLAPEVSTWSATHVIETNEGLIVIDTQTFRDYARQFRAYVDGLGKPVTHVIISHGHPDHYFGLEYFDDLPSYALAETREDMQERHASHLKGHRDGFGECDAVTDRVRFVAEDLEPGPQTIGGVELVFEKVVGGEDDDQLVVRIPAAKTLILQDLMATNSHAFTSAGMIEPWISTLRRYDAETTYTHILAGHGRPAGHESLGEMITYLETTQEIFDEVEDGEEFRTAIQQAFPARGGQFLVDLVAMLKYGS